MALTPSRPTDPLVFTERIVTADGKPTPYFLRQWLGQMGVNTSIDGTITTLEALQNLVLTAGVGLVGGGDLTADRVFDLEDTTVTAGTYTNTDLTIDAQGRITLAADGLGGGSSNVFHIQDQKATGTDAGTSVVGVQTRILNSTVLNTIAGASLATNQITLPAGTYTVVSSAPAYRADSHRTYLYNVSDSSITVLGGNSWNNSSISLSLRAELIGKFTITAAKIFELRHYIQTAATTFGLGIATSDGNTEVYAEVFISKEGSGGGGGGPVNRATALIAPEVMLTAQTEIITIAITKALATTVLVIKLSYEAITGLVVWSNTAVQFSDTTVSFSGEGAPDTIPEVIVKSDGVKVGISYFIQTGQLYGTKFIETVIPGLLAGSRTISVDISPTGSINVKQRQIDVLEM